MFAIEGVDKGIHLFLDNIRRRTNPAGKQSSGLNDRCANLLIAIATGPVTNGFVNHFPVMSIYWQQIIHALDACEGCGLYCGFGGRLRVVGHADSASRCPIKPAAP